MQASADVNLVIATWALVSATMGMAIIIWLTTRSSLKETRKSNELLEKELKTRLRPLFQLTNTKSSLQGSEDNWKVRLYYTIKNSGTVHARKIRIRTFESHNTEINHIVKEWDKIKNNSLSLETIQQGGELSRFDDVPWTKDKATTTWIIWMEYEFFNTKEKCVIIFPNFGAGQEPVTYKWFVHEDVVEAEQRRDDERAGKIGL